MQSTFISSFLAILRATPVEKEEGVKTIPVVLNSDQLSDVAGGLGPAGTWASTSSKTDGPAGTW